MARSPRSSFLTPKTGAAFFALRRRVRAGTLIGFARLVFLALMISSAVPALAAFGASVFFLSVVLNTPSRFLAAFPHWAIALWAVSCAVSLASACSAQLRHLSLRGFAAQSFTPALWAAVSDDDLLTPVFCSGAAGAGRDALNLLWGAPLSFGRKDAFALIQAVPVVAIGAVCIGGYLVSRALLFAFKFLAFCVEAARLNAPWLGPHNEKSNKATNGNTALSKSDASAFTPIAPAKISLRARLVSFLKSAIAGAIDSLAQEGGEELARREREALLRNVERVSDESTPRVSQKGAAPAAASRRTRL